MYILSVEEAQKDLAKVLEMVAEGKDVAIGGKYPALLLKVRTVINLSKDNPGSCGSIAVFHPEHESDLEDELVKPLPDDIIEDFYKPRIYDAPSSSESL